MNAQRCDTADRLRRGDTITHDGKRVLIADITLTDGGVLALLVVSPNGRTFGHDGAKLLLVGPGATIDFTPGRCDFGLAGHRPCDVLRPTQVRRRGLGFEVFDTLDCDWAYIGTGAPFRYTLGGPVEATAGNLNSLAAAAQAGGVR